LQSKDKNVWEPHKNTIEQKLMLEGSISTRPATPLPSQMLASCKLATSKHPQNVKTYKGAP